MGDDKGAHLGTSSKLTNPLMDSFGLQRDRKRSGLLLVLWWHSFSTRYFHLCSHMCHHWNQFKASRKYQPKTRQLHLESSLGLWKHSLQVQDLQTHMPPSQCMPTKEDPTTKTTKAHRAKTWQAWMSSHEENNKDDQLDEDSPPKK